MAQHRTYIVKMPTSQGSTSLLDIIVEGPVGSASAPVAGAGVAGPKTAPPAGWVGEADGAYYEWRGRTLRIPVRFAAGAAGGFVPRFRLGWKLAVYKLGDPDIFGAALDIFYSQSLLGAALPTAFAGAAAVIPDPTYGPVIRLRWGLPPNGGVTPVYFAVHLDVFEAKDEDRDGTGSV